MRPFKVRAGVMQQVFAAVPDDSRKSAIGMCQTRVIACL
jgi:ABC-type phosphate transport system permease subunit